MARVIALIGDAMVGGESALEARQAVGRFALEADTIDEDRFVEAFHYLVGEPWPASFRCTAVETETGELRVWDKEAGVELDRAVASSCAVPGIFPPITLAGHRYMDGGVRSGASADLAAGHDRVILVTLMGPDRQMVPGDDDRLAAIRARAEHEIDTVREAGGAVEVLGPDAESSTTMGMNLMDASLGPAAAEAGVAQGERAADSLRDFWGP
jgi:NTE family protein